MSVANYAKEKDITVAYVYKKRYGNLDGMKEKDAKLWDEFDKQDFENEIVP